jgi:hypothetical protein
MRKNLITSLLALTLLTLSTACSPEAGQPDDGYKRPKIWPKPTEPPPASPDYEDVEEKVLSEEDIDRAAAEYNNILQAELESALMGDDLVRRETVFVHILPELLQVDPKRVVNLHAGMKPGEPRETLCTEIAQLWASSDPTAAASWIKSLEGDERRSAAMTAVTTLAPWEPRAALRLADEFDLEKEAALSKLLKSVRQALVEVPPN